MEKPIAFLTYLYLDNVFDKVTPTHKHLSMKNDLITFNSDVLGLQQKAVLDKTTAISGV